MARRRSRLGDFRSEATKSDVHRWADFQIFSLSGERASVARVAKALGKDPTKFRGSCEAFGRQVECFVNGKTAELEQMSAALRSAKIRHRVQEYPKRGDGRLMIPVNYFKAWHWDE